VQRKKDVSIKCTVKQAHGNTPSLSRRTGAYRAPQGESPRSASRHHAPVAPGSLAIPRASSVGAGPSGNRSKFRSGRALAPERQGVPSARTIAIGWHAPCSYPLFRGLARAKSGQASSIALTSTGDSAALEHRAVCQPGDPEASGPPPLVRAPIFRETLSVAHGAVF